MVVISAVALVLATSAGSLQLPCTRLPCSALHHHSRVQLRRSSVVLDESAASTPDSDKKLVTMASLDLESLDILNFELNQRNKERFLEGKDQYASIEAMINEYVDFEGRDKGMTYVECEDAVLRYLQRRALLSEGADGITDPQTLVTLVLLGALVIGVVGNSLGLTDIPLPNNEPPP